MFIPNRWCEMRRSTGTNMYGDPDFGPKIKIRFALVRFDTKQDNSIVRADASATRGGVDEVHASGRILVPVSVHPKRGDMVIIDNTTFRIFEVEPRYHVLGHLDHYECDINKADDKYGDGI